MPEEEPVCDCEEGESPDPDPGCCGADTCEENETCCNETTCILTSTFQTDSNNCGDCGTVCGAGETCVAGACVGGGDTGCCKHYICTNNDGVWQYVYHEDSPSDEAACISMNDSAGIGSPNSPCDADPSNSLNNYFIWSSDPCPAGCCTHWNCVGGDPFHYQQGTPYDSSEANCIMLITEFNGDPSLPCNSTPRNYNNTYNTWSAGSCTPEPLCYYCQYSNSGAVHCDNVASDCPAGYVLGDFPAEYVEKGDAYCTEHFQTTFYVPCVPSGGALAAPKEGPCVQGECEEHISTWMAEPFGEPNEEGLYKVKWILLDGCPGVCCSDQPTQPEFVKKSTLIDALCKCGCN